MTTVVKWLSRLAIAWSLIFISYGLGCIVRGQGSRSWHAAIVTGHLVLLVVNARSLRRIKQRTL